MVVISVLLILYWVYSVYAVDVFTVNMEAVLVSYGRIVEGPRRSLSHMSSKDAGSQVNACIYMYITCTIFT